MSLAPCALRLYIPSAEVSPPQFPAPTGRPEDKQAAKHLLALTRKIIKIYTVV